VIVGQRLPDRLAQKHSRRKAVPVTSVSCHERIDRLLGGCSAYIAGTNTGAILVAALEAALGAVGPADRETDR
jgi:hypothetical protein